jgi:hypothetical protein
MNHLERLTELDAAEIAIYNSNSEAEIQNPLHALISQINPHF